MQSATLSAGLGVCSSIRASMVTRPVTTESRRAGTILVAIVPSTCGPGSATAKEAARGHRRTASPHEGQAPQTARKARFAWAVPTHTRRERSSRKLSAWTWLW